MPQVKAALYEIFTVAALAAATIAVLKAFGVSLPIVGGTIQDWAMVAVACAAGKLAK
ncbi:MAG: hypothetical protein WC807_18680 [Hyphomicrobium sp.]|jgi:hypothetical protein